MRAVLLGVILAGSIVAPAMACGPAGAKGPQIPPLAASLDHLLTETTLPEADAERVRTLRQQIAHFAAQGQEPEARKAEEEAMRLLGYKKGWLRCGPGTFLWTKINQPES